MPTPTLYEMMGASTEEHLSTIESFLPALDFLLEDIELLIQSIAQDAPKLVVRNTIRSHLKSATNFTAFVTMIEEVNKLKNKSMTDIQKELVARMMTSVHEFLERLSTAVKHLKLMIEPYGQDLE